MIVTARRGSKPRPSRARRLARAALLAGLATAAVIVLLLALRRPLAAWALRAALERRGVDVDHLEVAGLWTSGARLRAVSLGDGVATVDHIAVSYHLRALRHGLLDRIELSGPRFRVDLLGPRTWDWGALTEAQVTAVRNLGTVEVRDGRIAVIHALGETEVTLRGQLAADAASVLEARVDFHLEGETGSLGGDLEAVVQPQGSVAGTLRFADGRLALGGGEVNGLTGEAGFAWREGLPDRLAIRLTSTSITRGDWRFTPAHAKLDFADGHLTLDAGLTAPDGSLALEFSARATGLPVRADLEVDASAEVWLPGPLARFLTESPREGRLCATLTASGSLPLRSHAMKLAEHLTTTLDFELDSLRWPGKVGSGTAMFRLASTLAGQTIALDLAPGARLVASGINRGWLERLGLPAVVAKVISTGATITAGGHGELTLAPPTDNGTFWVHDLDLRARVLSTQRGAPDPLDLSGELSGPLHALAGRLQLEARLPKIDLPSLHATDVALSLPVHARLATPGMRLDFISPGELRAATLAAPGRFRLESPLRVQVPSGFVDVARGGERPSSTTGELHLAADDVTAVIDREERPIRAVVGLGSVAISGRFGGVAPRDFTARIDHGTLSLPDLGVAMDGISGRVHSSEIEPRPGSDPLVVNLRIGSLRSVETPPLFAPLRVEGDIVRDAGLVRIKGLLAFPGPSLPWALSGHHHLDSGSGELDFDSGTLWFAPDVLQPKDLAPRLLAFGAVRGRGRAEGQLRWGADGLASSARLQLDDIAIRSGELSLTGLSLDLELDSLTPMASRLGQCIAVRRIEASAGPPIENLSASFSVRPGPPTRLLLQTAEARFAGGRLTAELELLDPVGGSPALTVGVERLDLGELLRATRVNGLHGEGRFDGWVPIVVEGEDLVIAGGQLTANGPGVLSFRSARIHQLLAQGGESVDLMLKAIEDFHYSEFVAKFSQSAKGDTQIGLSLLGANPNVLEGYPFRFNVDVTGNTKSLLAALSQTYRLRHRLWMRALE